MMKKGERRVGGRQSCSSTGLAWNVGHNDDDDVSSTPAREPPIHPLGLATFSVSSFNEKKDRTRKSTGRKCWWNRISFDEDRKIKKSYNFSPRLEIGFLIKASSFSGELLYNMHPTGAAAISFSVV